MQPSCFRDYVQCVISVAYFDIAHDLDCALGLTHCALGMPAPPGEEEKTTGERVPDVEQVRTVLGRHTDELKRHNERIRDLGTAASDDESLMRDFDKFLDTIARDLERRKG
jgi:hypothetical protein